MPSNVRRHDHSCKEVTDNGSSFYQCSTCDKNGQLYICDNCYADHGHANHKVTKVTSTDGVAFCNCGDMTGIYFCSQHKRVGLKPIQLPLHFNDKYLDDFCKSFNVPQADARRLSRLNQIRKLYYKSEDAKLISEYFNNSIEQGNKFKIKSSWSVYRKDHEHYFASEGYNKTRRILLWHGTGIGNITGILENGFKRPANGSAHGAMFGTGCYFADRACKSVHYCFGGSSTGLLFLCEVALGSMWRTGLPKNYVNVPNNFDSIKGVGQYVPDKNDSTTFDGKIIVPSGKTVKKNHHAIVHSQIAFNEFIVFDTRRVLIKFIVQVETN